MTREEAERLLSLAREARFIGPAAPAWVERLASMREEFVEAARFLTSKGEEEAAADLAANVWRLWFLVGDVAGGRRLLAAALDVGRQPASRSRALALYGDGVLAFRAGEQAESEGRNEQALEVARAVGDREAEALALVGLSRVAFRDGDYEHVQALAEEARGLVRELDADADVPPLHLLAAGTRLGGDYNAAFELYNESL